MIIGVVSFNGTILVSATDNLSIGVQNMVKRAYQMVNIKWTPLKNVYGWGRDLVYYAGVEYTGLPYGQPVYSSYVPWTTSLDGFISAVNNIDSKMYTDISTSNAVAPYYSTDCSAFVSWAWDLSGRQTTRTIANFADYISNSSYEQAEVGDCLCKYSSHVVLITDLSKDFFGNVNFIEISEATVNPENSYCCQSVTYGKGGRYTMNEFKSKYFDDGYILYRSRTRDNVSYSHSCASPLDGDECQKCGFGISLCEHDYESSVAEEPSCTVTGKMQYKCSLCSKTYYETIPTVSHEYGEWKQITAPTCMSEGVEQSVCSVCNGIITRNTPMSIEHDWIVISQNNSTCTHEGSKELKCSYCNKNQTEIIPITEHSYKDGKCSVCGELKNKLKGDINSDGVVSSADAVLLARHLAGIVQLGKFADNADLNSDGVISSADAVVLAQQLVGI